MIIELFRSLLLAVLLAGSAIWLAGLLGSWMQHASWNEAQF
jgi:hypothetical protein